jgi:hypothetical protein
MHPSQPAASESGDPHVQLRGSAPAAGSDCWAYVGNAPSRRCNRPGGSADCSAGELANCAEAPFRTCGRRQRRSSRAAPGRLQEPSRSRLWQRTVQTVQSPRVAPRPLAEMVTSPTLLMRRSERAAALVHDDPSKRPSRSLTLWIAIGARWTIEELNAALKTGCAYESRQFESRHALLNILALTLPVACEVLALRSRTRDCLDAATARDPTRDRC